VTTLWRLSCGAGFRRKLLKLHTISGGNYACIYVIVNCLNNTPLAVRLFNVCLFGDGGFWVSKLENTTPRSNSLNGLCSFMDLEKEKGVGVNDSIHGK